MEGWICPKCGRVWAPFVPSCYTCNEPTMEITGIISTGDKIKIPETYTTCSSEEVKE